MRLVFLRGMAKSLISGRMDVENSISTVIQGGPEVRGQLGGPEVRGIAL